MAEFLRTKEDINISIYVEGTDTPVIRYISTIARPYNVGDVLTLVDESKKDKRYRVTTCSPRLIKVNNGLQYSYIYLVTEL